jgi:tetratricopeptide (TPR) repeat protein
MHPENEQLQNFINIAEMAEAIARGCPLPEFKGVKTGQWFDLYQILNAADRIIRKKADAARLLKQGVSVPGRDLICFRLLELWLDSDESNQDKAYQELSRLIQKSDSAVSSDCAITGADAALAALGSRMLRLFLYSLLDEIKPNQIIEADRDLKYLRIAGLPDLIINWFEFAVEFTQSREFADFEQMAALSIKWNEYCKKENFAGASHEFIIESLIMMELADRNEQALRLLEYALLNKPQAAEYLIIKSRLLKRQGRFGDSIDCSSKLIELYPNDHAGYCLRSNASFLAGDFEHAMQDALLACELFPGNPDCHMARAYVNMQNGDYQSALKDFETVTDSEAYHTDALHGIAKCLSMLGRDSEALAHLMNLKRMNPQDPDIFYELADVYFAAGYLDDCERVCKKCLQLEPSYVSAYVMLGLLALRRDQDDNARTLLTRAVEMEPDNPFALNELSYLRHLDGDNEEALELVERALSQSPDYADALSNKGTILLYLGDYEKAGDCFDNALNLVPDHVNALIGKAGTLTQTDEPESAMEYYDMVLEIEEDNLEACHGKSQLYQMLGLDREAGIWLEKTWQIENISGQEDSNGNDLPE